MEDIRFSEGKLVVGASWYQLSKIREVTVERTRRTLNPFASVAKIILPIFVFYVGKQFYSLWFFIVIIAGLTFWEFKTVCCFRLFVRMDSGKYEVARIVGVNRIFSKMKIEDADKRARTLADEIRARISDAVIESNAQASP